MHYGHCELVCERTVACLIAFIVKQHRQCKQPLGDLIALSLTLSSSVYAGTSEAFFLQALGWADVGERFV